MTPLAMSSATSSWSYFRKGSSASYITTGSSVLQSEQIHGSQDTSPGGDQRYLGKRPLRPNTWYKGKDGFLITDAWNANVGSSSSTTPTIFLPQTEERKYLCAHQYKNLTTLLLIPVASLPSPEQGISSIKQQVLENVSLRINKVEEKLSKGWGGENAYHVGGYRYVLVDNDRSVSRASPPAKVTTLAKESLVVMSKLREEVDLEKARAKWENKDHEKELEVCIRANNNAWAIARVTRGKELFIVLEKASETLLYAARCCREVQQQVLQWSFLVGLETCFYAACIRTNIRYTTPFNDDEESAPTFWYRTNQSWPSFNRELPMERLVLMNAVYRKCEDLF